MEEDKISRKEYNDIPVVYCKRCLSLNIGGYESVDEDIVFCHDCGATDIESTHIDVWRGMYKLKYGKDF